MLKILGKASSINVRKVLWACDEIGIPFEQEDWGAGFRDTASPEFLRLNPKGLVPVIVDADVVLSESNTIIRYLAAKYGTVELLATEPSRRASVEMWMDWQATELNASWHYAFQALVRKNQSFMDPDLVETSLMDWLRNMAILESRLEATKLYIAAPHFTLADIPIGLSVNRWFMTPMNPRPALPAVTAYYERLSVRAAFLKHGRNGIA